MKNLFAVLFLFFCVGLNASVLEELQTSAKKNPSSKIFITQQKTMSMFDEIIESKIVVFAEASGKMRMQTVSPFEAVSIFDSTKFVRFEKINGKWQKLDTPSSIVAKRIFDEIRNLLSGNISQSEYNIEQNNNTLVLVPKNKDVQKVVAKIEIFTTLKDNQRLVSSVKITDADADTTLLKFDKVIFATNKDDVFNTDIVTEISQ